MGLGLHGGGRAAAEWFSRHGASVIVTDQKNEATFEPTVNALRGIDGAAIEFHLGGHREDDFRSADLVIQNPGVPRESPYLAIARSHGVPIENEATIFFELTRNTKKICVTGTRGKSTTAALLGTMMSEWNKNSLVAGIASRDGASALFSILDRAIANERAGVGAPVVLELSSWQLELFEGRSYAPAIAVVTNVLPDHLNRYSSMEAYAAAKSLIFAAQGASDTLILNYDNPTTRQWGVRSGKPARYWFSSSTSMIDQGACVSTIDGTSMIVWKSGNAIEPLMSVKDIPLKGDHSLQNALAALTAANVFGIPHEQSVAAVRGFRGLPDRLETVSTEGGRIWINDTTATTPEAARAALESIDSEGRVILIAGGADKHLLYADLAALIAQRVFCVVGLSGTATPALVAALQSAGAPAPSALHEKMEDAVLEAWKVSKKGDTILLSPAAASFGFFENEFDRGRQFIKAIKTATSL